MNKIVIVGASFFVLGLLIGGLFNFVFTGSAVSDFQDVEVSGEYSYTRAICDSENKCLDVLIVCQNGSVKGIEPVSDLFDLGSWEDLRKQEDFCE